MNSPDLRPRVIAPLCLLPGLWLLLLSSSGARSAEPSGASASGARLLSSSFAAATASIEQRMLSGVQTAEDWDRLRPIYRRQLQEMLGLDPWPTRGDLKAVTTGTAERDGVVVEKIHFQSRPGLYVTANLYRPSQSTAPLPAILYLSGHGPVISNGVSYGNKVSYQHHGSWFARQGYICLVVDSLQLGEILGLHHGTYREGMWWWNARGYTPAGVEAWNSMRALDYLQSRPDVDATRLGVTGRSGGGAYSWWIAALDERIRAAAPVAGITDLHNHVIDGTVEGHCDCMFLVNTYRWDYPLVAALVAPRPLLIVNTDADSIFPLDGVVRTHAGARRVYDLLHASNQLGLVIGPGPHQDTQDLQVPVLRWFNRHLRGADPLITNAAVALFTPRELKVFDTLPTDSINTNIHETFVAAAPRVEPPGTAADWVAQRDRWMAGLREKVFAAWPIAALPVRIEQKFSAARDGVRFEVWEFSSEEALPLRCYVARPELLARPGECVLRLLNGSPDRAGSKPSFAPWRSCWQAGFARELAEEIAAGGPQAVPDASAYAAARRALLADNRTLVWLAPRGCGLTAWEGDARKQVQVRRRFMLLGQTLDSMRVWDIRRGLQALRGSPGFLDARWILEAEGDMACDALYAALFEPGLQSLELTGLPESHRQGPDYLNVLRVLDVPQTLAMVLERFPVRLHDARAEAWSYPRGVGRGLGWSAQQLTLTEPP